MRKRFLKNFEDHVAASLPVEAKGKVIEVWWQDEARVGQQAELTRAWAVKGSRPRQVKDQRFGYTYLFGAVCPQAGKGAALIMPSADSKAMNLHLQEISKQVAPDSHAIVILDRAGWHRSGELEVPNNLTLIHLPPYSPELNPVENVWQYLKDHFLRNRLFEDYETIVDACEQAWNSLISTPGLIFSIAYRHWACSINL